MSTDGRVTDDDRARHALARSKTAEEAVVLLREAGDLVHQVVVERRDVRTLRDCFAAMTFADESVPAERGSEEDSR